MRPALDSQGAETGTLVDMRIDLGSGFDPHYLRGLKSGYGLAKDNGSGRHAKIVLGVMCTLFKVVEEKIDKLEFTFSR
ncbi:hypothetical protein Dimus_023484 [Dionaea muscipula]